MNCKNSIDLSRPPLPRSKSVDLFPSTSSLEYIYLTTAFKAYALLFYIMSTRERGRLFLILLIFKLKHCVFERYDCRKNRWKFRQCYHVGPPQSRFQNCQSVSIFLTFIALENSHYELPFYALCEMYLKLKWISTAS